MSFSNVFIGEPDIYSSCCRLSNNIKKAGGLGFQNSFGNIQTTAKNFEKTGSALALARLTSLAPPHLTLLHPAPCPVQFLGPRRNKGFEIGGSPLDSQWAACKLCDLGPVAQFLSPSFLAQQRAVNMVFII